MARSVAVVARGLLTVLLLDLVARGGRVAAQKCNKCPGGGQTCCAPYGNCCNSAGNGGGYSCIADDETCCDGTACIKQTTYCCAASADPSCPDGKCPARCCPRWTVCCSKGGRDGCCSPFEAALLKATRPTNPVPAAVTSPLSGAAAGNGTVYAMFLEAGLLAEPLKVLTIDGGTGKITRQVKVTGYDTHGESTRLFELRTSEPPQFVTFENNFTAPGAGMRAVTMYTVDVATGRASAMVLRGAVQGYPTGYKYDAANDAMILATGPTPGEPPASPGRAAAPYSFYAVSRAGVCKPLATITAAQYSAEGADPLAGWLHAVQPSPSNLTVYRSGYLNASTSSGPGLGVTTLPNDAAAGGPPAQSSFEVGATAPLTHGFYLTLDASTQSGALYSMAPRDGLSTAIDLVRWAPKSAAGSWPRPQVVAALGDAHQPALFGDVAATLGADGSTWAGLSVMNPGIITNGAWVLSMVDLRTAPAGHTLLTLEPRVGGGTSSVSGLGLVQ